MTFIYAFIFIGAVIGAANLIMSYDEVKRSTLIVSAIFIVAAPLAALHIGIKPGVLEAAKQDIVGEEGPFILGGLVLATLFLFKEEGSVEWLWRRFSPFTAPTEDIAAGQRGYIARDAKNRSGTFMGTSTAALTVQGLDVKTVTLIRLAFHAFTRMDSRTVIGIENALRLGEGRRYAAFHRLAAQSQSCREAARDITHPYLRAINGNHAAARMMFRELCQLARQTQNTDRKTVNKLTRVGKSLGLTPEHMGMAISQLQ